MRERNYTIFECVWIITLYIYICCCIRNNRLSYRFINLAYNKSVSLLLDDENKIISPFNPTHFHSKKYFQNGYKDQILRIIKFLNRSNDMVSYIRETHDVRLSDVRRLEDGLFELADMVGLQRHGDLFTKCYEDIDQQEELDFSKELDKARGRKGI